MMTLTVDSAAVVARLNALASTQIPNAIKTGINTIATELVTHEREKMTAIFDRPKPFVVNGLVVLNRATATSLSAEIGFKESGGKRPVEKSLRPNTDHFPVNRDHKGSEGWLQAQGFLNADEWLVPSRTCPTDAYGNVSGTMMKKMLADIGMGTASRTAERYIFAQMHVPGGGGVKGIWWVKGGARRAATGRWKLYMVAVKKTPTYRKRFDFYGIARTYVSANATRCILSALPTT
ncbi:MAG: hypothetical protein JZU59_15405 [Chromatium okenii]|jgi:hypothetical protein|nr:hypothetical protein [Chromatium okenii]